MIVLVAMYHCKEGKRAEVEANLARMAPLVKAGEPGCVLYHASRGKDDPNLILLYEQYVDEAAIDAHRNTPHFKEIIEETIIPLLEKRERSLYELAVS